VETVVQVGVGLGQCVCWVLPGPPSSAGDVGRLSDQLSGIVGQFDPREGR